MGLVGLVGLVVMAGSRESGPWGRCTGKIPQDECELKERDWPLAHGPLQSVLGESSD